MSCYIASNENRFYAAVEPAFGVAADVNSANRISAVRLAASQRPENVRRVDKTGSRTFVGLPYELRKQTDFELTTYMTTWLPQHPAPLCDPLVLAALGGTPLTFSGGVVDSIAGNQLTLTAAHGLVEGQAVSCGGEIRFVTSVADPQSVFLNAPFTESQAAGWPVDRTITYVPATELPSATIFDYWSPDTAVHRLLAGSAVDKMKISVNADFHEFTFSGPAMDLIDSASFVSGQAGLTEYPVEPQDVPLDYSLIPGHLGQVWMGSAPDRFFTLTGAEVTIDNNVDLRAQEFGMMDPRCLAAGMRSVTSTFTLYEMPDAATKGLYQAARQRTPIGVMFQLGQIPSQLCGVYMKGVTPEVPEFDDDETKLEWRFENCRAQGTVDDEVYIAFG